MLVDQNGDILFCLRAWWSKRLTTRHTYVPSARFCGMSLCSVVSKNDLQAHLVTGLKNTCTKAMDSRKRKALMDILYHIARARGFTISSYCEARLNSSTPASLSGNPGNHAFHICEAYHRPVTSASLDKTSTNQLASLQETQGRPDTWLPY